MTLKGEELKREARFWSFMFVLLGIMCGSATILQVRLLLAREARKLELVNNRNMMNFSDVAVHICFGKINDATASDGFHQYTQASGWMV